MADFAILLKQVVPGRDIGRIGAKRIALLGSRSRYAVMQQPRGHGNFGFGRFRPGAGEAGKGEFIERSRANDDDNGEKGKDRLAG